MSAEAAAAERLLVIDRLEVGPARLESDQLVAPYTVWRNGAASSVELSYRYEEPVFDPAAASSANLAAMMAAQVALNYGLFCRQIVLHGPLDRVDRRLLAEMAANTAREIYVKKLLEPNPFLVGPVAELPPVPMADYLQAELIFPEAVEGDGRGGDWPSVDDASRVAVLSSGGKDSLLSQGLLDEMGLDTHSVFVNESGRHWHTAINAYRQLRRERGPRVARVWTSSDRVFSFMLRQLPFVRQDFARQRSDEYPIRLWTVAVFLVGALPLLRKRGVRDLVLGDEHDTTRRLSHHGIPHYDGLYDQSRFFDERLGRYYRSKGWPLRQYSLLRPLSELLIQKTLGERYGELHRLQMSCHATHLSGERAAPCGRCEKCRRIVAMHVALELDPAHCGYAAEQVERCLAEVAEQGVHQEKAGARQLAWMLCRAGRLSGESPFGARAEHHPEVLRLRFHPQAAPVEGLPREIRRPLFELLLQHAEGAVEWRERQWLAVDPLSEELLARPYRLERPARGGRSAGGAGGRPPAAAEPPGGEVGGASSGRPDDESDGPSEGAPPEEYLLGELTWPRAGRRFKDTDTALLPVGATEQHGPHLPLDTDSWDAEYLSAEVARRVSHPKPLVLPLIPYGVSYHHQDFPGTLSISPETLSRMVYEVGISAARHGIAKLVIINGHGGNGPALQYAAQMINRDAHIFTCVDSGETSDSDIAEITETPNDVHAGEVETSTSLATRPHLVDMRRAKRAVPRFSSQYLDFSSQRGIEWYAHTGRLSRSGVLGDPTRATVDKGRRYWELMIGHLVAFVEQIKGMSLAEIHERRQ